MLKEMNTNGFGELRILVTGAGGPAAIAVMRSLGVDPKITLIAADMDPWASGLYLLRPENRVIILPAGDPGFIENLLHVCKRLEIGILISTVDGELEPIAENIDRFAALNTKILGAPPQVLKHTLDKLRLATTCKSAVRVPRTELLLKADLDSWEFPVIIKPRRGSGSRGVLIIHNREELPAGEKALGMIIQEYLPGEEFSIDVLATRYGIPISAVPRLRVRVDSGIAIAGRTLRDTKLEEFARAVVTTLGLPFISNVQARRNIRGELCLLEVNPRVPGSLALTRAAGVDMVRLAVDELCGKFVPKSIVHREVAMVRPLADLVIECSDLVPGAIPGFVSAHPTPAIEVSA